MMYNEGCEAFGNYTLLSYFIVVCTLFTEGEKDPSRETTFISSGYHYKTPSAPLYRTPTRPTTHNSFTFSFCLLSLLSASLKSCLPVSGLRLTASSPPIALKALWKTHSVAISTGSSNM